MDREEIRLRAILSNRTGDVKYVRDIPTHLHFAALYPETMKKFEIVDGKVVFQDDEYETKALSELKERLDNDLK